MLMLRESASRASRTSVIDSLRVQALIGIVIVVLLPALVRYPDLAPHQFGMPVVVNSIIGCGIGLLLGLFLFRRVTAFPGTGAYGVILPSFATSYGMVALTMFSFRLDYSRFYLGTSFVLALVVTYVLSLLLERYTTPRFHVVPFGQIAPILDINGVDWTLMEEPSLPNTRSEGIVADLRFDHDPTWERMLAEAAVSGRPVYHTKQLGESLTGRVSIEHLSENSFGSLMPNLAYVKIKRLLDLASCTILVPLWLVPMLLIALLIRLDSPGPVLFKQLRMGYRGKTFLMYKFRTMTDRPPCADEEAARHEAMTQSDDARITRLGRTLRRLRIDELPQLLNVIRGEMSLIGPRPEAVALSCWYEAELPFYFYRHIVRPGLTGWAQVHQGHVTDLDAVNQKLNYDFYYIKNFSAWLDVLILLRTIPTMLSGFGSR